MPLSGRQRLQDCFLSRRPSWADRGNCRWPLFWMFQAHLTSPSHETVPVISTLRCHSSHGPPSPSPNLRANVNSHLLVDAIPCLQDVSSQSLPYHVSCPSTPRSRPQTWLPPGPVSLKGWEGADKELKEQKAFREPCWWT